MIQTDSAPEATASSEDHADYLELSVLRSISGSYSLQEFVRDLRIGNAAEVIADATDQEEGQVDEESEALGQAAFDELDERRRNFGEFAEHYPFVVSDTTLTLKPDGEKSLYTFLALLSWYGLDAGAAGTSGEQIFEDVCAKAAESYLGGEKNRAKSHVFGFPRRVLPAGFASALDKLCKDMGEGVGHHKGRAKLPDQKDGKLDIVAWLEFADNRQGKVITFGQCATGKNWEKSSKECVLQPAPWCSYWMEENPSHVPFRSFFVPHRIERENWYYTCIFGGVLYDRCRIASLASSVTGALRNKWIGWSDHVLKKIKGT
jgi:hypothetical protein